MFSRGVDRVEVLEDENELIQWKEKIVSECDFVD
jgi:hypothetical protein